ncbi:hypothetical protein K402DRAFT_214512 [Aulographum hederae CBS 113979]|uniref:CCHC-type domain-containing protein n=1 Tax=Aulographum hederae CBS 113979 TaxID=1176131 RepID=A0A6G1GM80_9PEZI|nr:hypothetical protein K402DRAFT_214512 [Aulographum hederae CBS 113979]
MLAESSEARNHANDDDDEETAFYPSEIDEDDEQALNVIYSKYKDKKNFRSSNNSHSKGKRKPREGTGRAGPSRSANISGSFKRSCYNCGKPGHISGNCRKSEDSENDSRLQARERLQTHRPQRKLPITMTSLPTALLTIFRTLTTRKITHQPSMLLGNAYWSFVDD